MLSGMARRARPVSEEWLAAARERRKEMGLRLADLGEAMAAKVGREQPYSIPAVSDVLSGRGYSAEMVEALAEVLGLDLPPVAIGDAQIQEWAELGQHLQRLSPSHFEKELDAVRELVAALKKFESRR